MKYFSWKILKTNLHCIINKFPFEKNTTNIYLIWYKKFKFTNDHLEAKQLKVHVKVLNTNVFPVGFSGNLQAHMLWSVPLWVCLLLLLLLEILILHHLILLPCHSAA